MNDFFNEFEDDDEYEVVLRGDRFIATEDFEILSISPGRGSVKQQIIVKKGDNLVFNGEIVNKVGDRIIAFYEFLFFPMSSNSPISEMKITIIDKYFIFNRLERIQDDRKT